MVEEDTYEDNECYDLSIHISDLPDALDITTYTHQRHTLIIDNKEAMGSRFLRYQRGCYLQYHKQTDIEPESLRKNLVGALQFGTNFVLSFDQLPADDISLLFQDDTCFPKALLSRSEIFKKSTWEPLLRPETTDDPKPSNFLPLNNFKLIVVTKNDPPQQGLDILGANVSTIRIQGTGTEGDQDYQANKGNDSDAIVAGMFGLKLIKRNSEAMCDAAFDGELDNIVAELEKGFDLESTQPDGATSLSEAASQGHNEIVQHLIDLGADPNAQNDQGRSPLFRASFNGHLETVKLLLSVGGDPDLKTNEAEAPYMVAKTEEVRTLIDEWNREEVQALIVVRKQLIKQKLEERMTNAAERDLFAREQIRNSLVQKSKNGDVEGLKLEIEDLVVEAEKENQKRPRGNCQVRDDSGQTLLMVACQANQLNMVTFLLEHYKSLENDMFTDQPTLEKRSFRSNVNARDSKGWNPCSVASFHGNKNCLLMVLKHGGNPRIKNFYGKDSFDIVQTEKDLLGAVLREGKPEILSTLEMWEAEQQKEKLMGRGEGGLGGGFGGGLGGGLTVVDKALAEGLKDAGPIALQQEMAKENAAGGGAAAVKSLKKAKKKGSGGGGKNKKGGKGKGKGGKTKKKG